MTHSDLEKRIYRNLHTLYVLLDDGDRRALNQVDLTTTQFNFLRTLDAAETDSLTVSEVADVLLCTRGNVTRLVKRLTPKNLVRVGSDDNDQRLVRIYLTSEGKAQLEQARQLHEASIRRRLASFTPAQLEQLFSLTETAVSKLQADLTALESN